MRISLESGPSFDAEPAERLLDAALRAGLTPDYSCRTGRCGSCRTQVLEGSTQALDAETGLEPDEAAQHWVLGCARTATSPVRLVWPMPKVALPKPGSWPCRIDAIEPLAPDVLRVTLRLPPSSKLNFLPGQFIELSLPEQLGGGKRSYSLAQAPRADGKLALDIRAVPGGQLSRYWFEQARANDLLRLHGPHGSAVLDPQATQLLMLATGTGIAPLRAMIESLPQDGSLPVSLYWGGRVPGDLYWTPPAWVDYVPVLSRADAQWTGARGHVQDVLLARQAGLLTQAGLHVHACGSEAMVRAARQRLREAGLSQPQFHADPFVCSAPAAAATT